MCYDPTAAVPAESEDQPEVGTSRNAACIPRCFVNEIRSYNSELNALL